MKEVKFIEVGPSKVEKTIEVWQTFGWEMVGAPQEIFNKTAHRTQETDKHYSTEYTSTTHYVKITFQRDKAMPNYAELVALERQYNSVMESTTYVPNEPTMGGVAMVIAILLILVSLGVFMAGVISVGMICIVAGGAVLIGKFVSYQKQKEEWQQARFDAKEDVARNRNKGKKILKQAQNLLDEENDSNTPALVTPLLDAEELCRRGNIYFDKGGYEEAIAKYEAALRIDPNHASAKVNLENARKRLMNAKNVSNTTADSSEEATFEIK